MAVQVQDSAPTTRAIVRVFNVFDRDGSGALSVKELSTALRELGLDAEGGGGWSTGSILTKYDADASRTVDLGEFTRVVLEVRPTWSPAALRAALVACSCTAASTGSHALVM